MLTPCPCAVDVLQLAVWLGLPPGGVSYIEVAHDPWCLLVGGHGSRPCVPEYSMPPPPWGRRIERSPC